MNLTKYQKLNYIKNNKWMRVFNEWINEKNKPKDIECSPL